MMSPLAFGSHHGAPSPVNAGTKKTPLEDSADFASASISDDCDMNFMLSRIHCTTAPPIKMLPSRAYSSFRAGLQVSVVSSRWLERVNCSPAFCSRKHPVPYVHFASPARVHKW